ENPSRTSHNYNAVGRLRAGETVEQANKEIAAIARHIRDTSSEQGDYLLKDGTVIPLQDSITGEARSPLLVLLGAVGFLLLVACGLGAFTATRATSGDPGKGIVEGARGAASSRHGQRVGRAIVAAQIAITLILVVGAGLLGRSLMKVLQVNPGFRVDQIVTMDISLPWAEDQKAKASQASFFSTLIDRLKQIPGVREVGAASGLPLVDGG